MSLLKSKIKSYIDDSVPLEMKKFDLIIPLSIIASFISIFIFMFGKLKQEIVYFSIFIVVFSVLVQILAHHKNEYKLYTIIYIVVSNFFIYPLCFFLTADIYNGTPLYLAIGIILTFFLFEGKKLILFIALEIGYYTFLIYFSYIYRPELQLYHNDSKMGDGISFCFFFAAMYILVILFFLTKIYTINQENTENSNNHLSAEGIVKSRFLSNMTNEIRTPINAIFGMVEVILKEELTEDAREYTDTIKSASSELLTIINNVLVYSKLDSNKMELIPTRYNFKDLINDVIHSVVLEYSELKTDFSVFIDHNIPTFVYGDDIRIKQVFRYLIFSSFHRIPHGEIYFEVLCEKNSEDHTITFKCKVTESGKGLTDSELKAVFGAYNEFDSRQSSDFKGMGLEIFICRKILNLMDGSLKIESVSGIGMAIIFEFTNYVLDDDSICEVTDSHDKNVLIYLDNKKKQNNWMPLMENLKVRYTYASGVSQFKTALEEKKYTHIFISDNDYESLKSVLENASCEEKTYVVTDQKHSFEDFGLCRIVRRPLYCVTISDILNNEWKKEDYLKPDKQEFIYYPDAKVLVVDDNIVNLKVILSNLDKYKIKADMATSGEGCLNILNEKKYDLLLLDQLMPGMSGVETLNKIRESGGINADIKTICITAEFGADVRERLISEGFCDYLAKPIKSFYLNRMLRRFLPEELAVVSSDDSKNLTVNAEVKETVSKSKGEDPLELNTSLGIELVGGSEEVYNTILVTYYQEGLKKMEEIPKQMTDTDLSLYSTNVHALKSSSASIGATNLSARFKALEMAGKAGNKEFVEKNTADTMDLFSKMLNKLSEYMTERGIDYGEDITDNCEPEGEEMILESSVISDLQKNLANVNLKYCEDAIKDLSSHNYGKNLNNQINEIRKKYEQFDYRSVKVLLEEMYNNLVS